MKKRTMLAAALACLLLSGCASLLERDYSVVEPYANRYWDTSAEDTLRAESYQDLVNSMLLLVEQQAEEGVIRCYDEADAYQEILAARGEVRRETMPGSYLLEDLQNSMGLTYLFITHDLSVVHHFSDEIAVMYLGKLIEKAPSDQLFQTPMHPYTQALTSAIPIPNPHLTKERIVLQGDVPSPANPPKGCPFHTRCSHCMEICSQEKPPIVEKEPGHFVACHLFDKKKENV